MLIKKNLEKKINLIFILERGRLVWLRRDVACYTLYECVEFMKPRFRTPQGKYIYIIDL